MVPSPIYVLVSTHANFSLEESTLGISELPASLLLHFGVFSEKNKSDLNMSTEITQE